jgi:hypothetical protein
MSSKEDEIALIVEGHYIAANELRLLWKESGQHSANLPTMRN